MRADGEEFDARSRSPRRPSAVERLDGDRARSPRRQATARARAARAVRRADRSGQPAAPHRPAGRDDRPGPTSRCGRRRARARSRSLQSTSTTAWGTTAATPSWSWSASACDPVVHEERHGRPHRQNEFVVLCDEMNDVTTSPNGPFVSTRRSGIRSCFGTTGRRHGIHRRRSGTVAKRARVAPLRRYRDVPGEGPRPVPNRSCSTSACRHSLPPASISSRRFATPSTTTSWSRTTNPSSR